MAHHRSFRLQGSLSCSDAIAYEDKTWKSEAWLTGHNSSARRDLNFVWTRRRPAVLISFSVWTSMTWSGRLINCTSLEDWAWILARENMKGWTCGIRWCRGLTPAPPTFFGESSCVCTSFFTFCYYMAWKHYKGSASLRSIDVLSSPGLMRLLLSHLWTLYYFAWKNFCCTLKTGIDVIIITQNRSTATSNKTIQRSNTTTTFSSTNITTVIAIAANIIASTTFTSITTIIFVIFITPTLIFNITTTVTETSTRTFTTSLRILPRLYAHRFKPRDE